MTKEWTCPEITAPEYLLDMQKQPHILIGGTTGAGKSVAMNGFIYTLLRFAPCEMNLMLIDPKGVELIDYRDLPHTIGHYSDPMDIDKAITLASEIMQKRFKTMTSHKPAQKMSTEPDLYIVIDEYMDIMLNCPKQTIKNLMWIASKGRAARVHIVLCTQRPCADVVDGRIKANFNTVLALRTANPQDSRNLIGQVGCEDFPDYGKAYYKTPTNRSLELVDIPLLTDEQIADIVTFWEAQK